MKVMDQTDDACGRRLYRILKDYSAPEFVKDASAADVYGPDDKTLPTRCYGDPSRRKFPCHTPAATWVSTAFYLSNRSEMDPKLASWVGCRLKDWADSHKIRLPVYELIEKMAAEAPAPKDEDFAVVFPDGKGGKERHCPLRNAAEVKAAALYLRKHRDAIPYAARSVMAEKILEKAAAYGADLGGEDEFLEKQAGAGGCSSEHAAGLIWDRVRRLGRTDKPSGIQVGLAKMAAALGESGGAAQDQGVMKKLAGILDAVDRSAGLCAGYGDGVDRPEDVLFGVTRKAASRLLAEHCNLQSGSVYKIADFSGVGLDDLRRLLGDEFADTVGQDGLRVSPEKLAELAATLPRPDAELLDRLLKDAGLEPVYKEAAADVAGFTASQWKNLAAGRGS